MRTLGKPPRRLEWYHDPNLNKGSLLGLWCGLAPNVGVRTRHCNLQFQRVIEICVCIIKSFHKEFPRKPYVSINTLMGRVRYRENRERHGNMYNGFFFFEVLYSNETQAASLHVSVCSQITHGQTCEGKQRNKRQIVFF